MENETVCGYIATVSPWVWRHRNARIKKLLRGRRCEHAKMGYFFPNHVDLWCCFGGREEDLAICFLYEKLLAVK
jgi:hypothetical protein